MQTHYTVKPNINSTQTFLYREEVMKVIIHNVRTYNYNIFRYNQII